MNLLKIYPKKVRLEYEKNIRNSGIDQPPATYYNKSVFISFIISLLSISVFFFWDKNMFWALGVFIFLNIFSFMKISLKAITRIKKIESVFPDVISLMASNLRAGMTIEKAFLLAARPEFDPLDKEILAAGKEISTGKEVVESFKKMSQKLDSEKISRVIGLIISGLKAGGNIADLLEQTAKNLKEKEIIEKKTASTTLMYSLFIFVAVSVGAPILFGLSAVLVEVIINITGNVPELGNTDMNLPFTFSKLSISVNFVTYFALAFLMVTDFISCFVIGIVNKGEARSGLKYFLPILSISIVLFFIIKKVLSTILFDLLGGF